MALHTVSTEAVGAGSRSIGRRRVSCRPTPVGVSCHQRCVRLDAHKDESVAYARIGVRADGYSDVLTVCGNDPCVADASRRLNLADWAFYGLPLASGELPVRRDQVVNQWGAVHRRKRHEILGAPGHFP
jgi:hypothetical protein